MSEIETASTVTGAISLLQKEPFNLERWQRLSACLSKQKDSLSTKSLETIVDGLKELRETTANALQTGGDSPTQTQAHVALFIRLATSYNEPRIFRDIGKVYLHDWHLPKSAQRHFERALRLGGSEAELKTLIEQAAVAVRSSTGTGTPRVHTGLRDADHAHPIVTEVLRQSGRLLTSKAARVSKPMPPPKIKIRELLPNTTKDCLDQAAVLLAVGDLARVSGLLLRANENPAGAPAMRQAWANLGMASYEQGAYAEMEEAYQWARHFDPKGFTSAFNLGLAQQLMQKYEEAEATYLAADRLEPNHAKVWCNLGAVYFQKGLYDRAEKASLKAIEIRRDYARAWDNLASSLGAQNKLDEALDACRKALAIQPNYPEPYFKMGMIYFGRNSLREAMDAFQKCLSPVGMAPYAQAFLAIINARLEDTVEAARALKSSLEANPQCELLWMAWNELGHAQYTLGNYAEAIVSYEQATLLNTGEAEAWLHLGLAHHAMENRVEAQKCYQKAIELNPKSYSAWHNLGIIYAELGRDADATHAFQNEARIETTSARAWYDLGVSLEREGRTREAQEAFSNAEAFAKLGYK